MSYRKQIVETNITQLYCGRSGSTSRVEIYSPPFPEFSGGLVVVTCAAIMMDGGDAEGEWCVLDIGNQGFLAGFTGAGFFDNFHFSGELVCTDTDTIGVTTSGVEWFINVAGYLAMDHASLVPFQPNPA